MKRHRQVSVCRVSVYHDGHDSHYGHDKYDGHVGHDGYDGHTG